MIRIQRLLLAPLLVLCVTVGALAQGTVKITNVTSPVLQGGTATVTAAAPPNAQCTVSVHYKRGASKAKGLEAKTADAKGSVSWTWHVGSKTTPGSWPVTVTANPGGSATAQLVVNAKPGAPAPASPAPSH